MLPHHSIWTATTWRRELVQCRQDSVLPSTAVCKLSRNLEHSLNTRWTVPQPFIWVTHNVCWTVKFQLLNMQWLHLRTLKSERSQERSHDLVYKLRIKKKQMLDVYFYLELYSALSRRYFSRWHPILKCCLEFLRRKQNSPCWIN